MRQGVAYIDMSREPSDYQQYDDAEFIEAVRTQQPVGTTTVSETVECSRETARLRLNKLEQQGEIAKKEISQGNVWYTKE